MDTEKVSSEGEDIPSDFFDDFTKDEFIEGLSVIDSWDGSENTSRIPSLDMQKLDRVRDLRDLIHTDRRPEINKYKWVKPGLEKSSKDKQSKIDVKLKQDNKLVSITPGSRRDPNKTNEAIKKDKELKVKERLAKHLESTDDLRPPGTELDDLFDTTLKQIENIEEAYEPPLFTDNELPDKNRIRFKRKDPAKHSESPVRQREFITRHNSPIRHCESPLKRRSSPYFKGRESPLKRRSSPFHHKGRDAPHRRRNSPIFKGRESPPRYHRKFSNLRRPRYSPPKRSRSPQYRNLRRQRPSPRRLSPPLQRHRSRSPYKSRARHTRSRSRSQSHSESTRSRHDDFLYPKEFPQYTSPKIESYSSRPQYGGPMSTIPTMETPQTYSYSQMHPNYSTEYNYSNQPILSVMPTPQPVPPPIMNLSVPMPVNPSPVPQSLPQPQKDSPSKMNIHMPQFSELKREPSVALAKLVADGKLSHEDYLKLAPIKGSKKMDTHARVAVLNRCNTALSKLTILVPPNRLLINNNLIGQEPKPILPKFCSPLKRQAIVEFHFTKHNQSAVALQNKHILTSLISALSLDKIVSPPKETVRKDVKDAAVQTMKPFCDVCDIRETMKYEDAGTSTDPGCISSSVHTQVVEQDLINSKAVFNPTGSVADGAPISIAHMTPAQLVSQLAARAKTFKQSEPQPGNSFHSSQGPYNYKDRRDRGFYNNYNYRY